MTASFAFNSISFGGKKKEASARKPVALAFQVSRRLVAEWKEMLGQGSKTSVFDASKVQ